MSNITNPMASVVSRPSALLVSWRLFRMLALRNLSDRSSWLLPVAAFGITNTLVLSTAGGIGWFWRHAHGDNGGYRFLAMFAAVLLVIPLTTLAAAAARLSAMRRNTRLSSLRLLGATAGTVHVLTLIENTTIALLGCLAGVVGYLLLMPVFGMLTFMGQAIGPVGVWLGGLPILAIVAATTVLAAISSALGLRKVVISPLGVRTRQTAPKMHWLRIVLGVAAIIVTIVAGSAIIQSGIAAGIILVVILIMLAIPLLAVNLLGPWLIGLVAKIQLGFARRAESILAARSVLENPKQVWRQVGALALISFASVFIASTFAVAEATGSTGQNVEETMMFVTDIRTGALLTLLLAFVTVACSTGIQQTAAIMDRRNLYVGLDMLGMPKQLINKARRLALLTPVLFVIAAGQLPAFALAGLALREKVFSPIVLGWSFGITAVGVALLLLSIVVTDKTLSAVIKAGVARAE